MTLARPAEQPKLPGWLHGTDPAVLHRAAEAFGLSVESLQLLSALKAIGAVLDQLEAAAWATVELTPAQGWVLAQLVLIGPCPQHVLAQRLMVTPSSISQVTTRLENQGLLTRQPDRTDRRVRHLSATPAADLRVRAVVPTVRATLDSADTALGAHGARQLLARLATLHHSLVGGDLSLVPPARVRPRPSRSGQADHTDDPALPVGARTPVRHGNGRGPNQRRAR